MLEDGLSWSNELKESWRFKSSSGLEKFVFFSKNPLFFGKRKQLQNVAGE